MSDVFNRRREYSKQRLASFQAELENQFLASEADVLEKLCIYATGSGGREEMTDESDVDLFVTRRLGRGKPAKNLRDVVVQASIVRASDALKFPEPSRDGQFLRVFRSGDLAANMGTDEDEKTNSFTARLLLFLESKPVLGRDEYDWLVTDVVDGYLRDYKGHEADYLPYLLTNDIVRFWRLLLVNYDVKVRREKNAAKQAGIRGYQGYKLRFSRTLTCYATIAWLLARISSVNTVTRSDLISLVGKAPRERLAEVGEFAPAVRDRVAALEEMHDGFLERVAERELRAEFDAQKFRTDRRAEGTAFGDELFELLKHFQDERLYRFVVV